MGALTGPQARSPDSGALPGTIQTGKNADTAPISNADHVIAQAVDYRGTAHLQGRQQSTWSEGVSDTI